MSANCVLDTKTVGRKEIERERITKNITNTNM